MARIASPEILVCDSSFVWHFVRQKRNPERYAHWGDAALDRINVALLTISTVTLAESRAGYLSARWGRRRVIEAERDLERFVRIPFGSREIDAWARLWVAARARGVAIGDNDLWIAATASVREQVLVTCDRDHQRIAADLPVDVVFLAPPV